MHRTAGLSRGNGADDETSRSDPESDAREADLGGSGRDHRSNRSYDAAVARAMEGARLQRSVGLPQTAAKPERVPVDQLQQVLQLYQEKYFDFNVQHFHEKLDEVHDMHFSYTWVKTALQEAGLVPRRKKPGSHRKRRPRRPIAGMMLHMTRVSTDGLQDRRVPTMSCW